MIYLVMVDFLSFILATIIIRLFTDRKSTHSIFRVFIYIYTNIKIHLINNILYFKVEKYQSEEGIDFFSRKEEKFRRLAHGQLLH